MSKLFFEKWREKSYLTDKEQEKIKDLFTLKKLVKGESFFRSGDICTDLAFIEKGALRTYVLDSKGNELVIFFGFEGWTIGDLNSFMNLEPTRYNIDAIEDSELLLLSKGLHDRMLNEIPSFEKYLRILMTDAYISIQKRTVDMICEPLENRYKKLLHTAPNLVNRVPQYMIASFLGVSPETLSRLRSRIRL